MNTFYNYNTFLQKINEHKLLEKKGDSYDYGCAMLYFKFPELKELHKKINKKDLYTEKGDRTYGIEDEPHCTLLFGFHKDVKEKEVIKKIKEFDIKDLKIHNPSAFKNEKYDILKFDIDADYLHKINEALTKFPHTTDFPDYHPHITIAYLMSEESDKYIEIMKGLEYTVKPNKIVYSKPSGDKITAYLNKGYM